PQQRRHPHPEDRAGTAVVDRDRDTRDVADPDRRRKRSRQRLEVRYVTRLVRIVVLPRSHSESMTQPTDLDEAETQRQEDTHAQEGHDNDWDRFAADRYAETPNVVVQQIHDLVEELHSLPRVGWWVEDSGAGSSDAPRPTTGRGIGTSRTVYISIVM